MPRRKARHPWNKADEARARRDSAIAIAINVGVLLSGVLVGAFGADQTHGFARLGFGIIGIAAWFVIVYEVSMLFVMKRVSKLLDERRDGRGPRGSDLE